MSGHIKLLLEQLLVRDAAWISTGQDHPKVVKRGPNIQTIISVEAPMNQKQYAFFNFVFNIPKSE